MWKKHRHYKDRHERYKTDHSDVYNKISELRNTLKVTITQRDLTKYTFLDSSHPIGIV